MDSKLIKSIELEYARTGSIKLGNNTCKICEKEKLCIEVDGSEYEYGEISICKSCIDNIFNDKAEK